MIFHQSSYGGTCRQRFLVSSLLAAARMGTHCSSAECWWITQPELVPWLGQAGARHGSCAGKDDISPSSLSSQPAYHHNSPLLCKAAPWGWGKLRQANSAFIFPAGCTKIPLDLCAVINQSKWETRFSKTERGRKKCCLPLQMFCKLLRKGMAEHIHSEGMSFPSVARELLNPANPSARSSVQGVRHWKGLKTKAVQRLWPLSMA